MRRAHLIEWWRAMRRPLSLFVVLASLLAATDADALVARWLFFDAHSVRWLGADSWWTNRLIHEAGGWVVRALMTGGLALWIATFVGDTARRWRRPAAYFIAATLLTVAIVGLLKRVTNVDCPWDLVAFGGRFPYVPLFADRPDALRAAHCFPAAHAGSGYALFALYFIGREFGPRMERVGLWAGGLTGLVFGIAQQSRGAHFLSHDIWSATLAWITCCSVYYLGFRGCLRGTYAATSPASTMLAGGSLINMP